MLKTCLIVGLGSMLGGMLRFWVARITPPAAGCAFPTSYGHICGQRGGLPGHRRVLWPV